MARSNKYHEPKKEALIQMSLDLFLENGYENTNITQIMKSAGLSKGGMYHYFSSKEEILNEVILYGLQQEISRLKTEIEILPIEEKLLHILKDNDLSDFTRKLLKYKDDNRDSIVAYRVREQNIYLCIPVVTDILEQGIAAGIYHTNYPKEMAEFFMLLFKAVIETNILTTTSGAEQKKRVDAFLHIFQNSLSPSPSHLEQIREAIGVLFIRDKEKTK